MKYALNLVEYGAHGRIVRMIGENKKILDVGCSRGVYRCNT